MTRARNAYKKKAPLGRLRQGAVSRKRPVLTGRGGESEARPRAPACIMAERSVKTKRPPAYWAGGRERQAAGIDRLWSRERNEVERYIKKGAPRL